MSLSSPLLKRYLSSEVTPHDPRSPARLLRPDAVACKPLPRYGDIQRNDLGELHGNHELPEARGLAVADIPDVYGGLVQVLSRSFASSGVASDYGDGITGCHE